MAALGSLPVLGEAFCHPKSSAGAGTALQGSCKGRDKSQLKQHVVFVGKKKKKKNIVNCAQLNSLGSLGSDI